MRLQWILALLILTPFLLITSVFLPPAQWTLIVLWPTSVMADLHSTHKFYLENPAQFSQNERNKVFALLTEKLGFKKASAIFPLIFEAPLVLFFALFPLQLLYSYIFNSTSSNFPACLATSLGLAGVGHIQAAFTNLHFKTRKNVPSERRRSATNALHNRLKTKH